MKQEIIYVPVKVEDELPVKETSKSFWHDKWSIDVIGLDKHGDHYTVYFDLETKTCFNRCDDGVDDRNDNVTHWLKPVQSVYVLTEDELNKIKMGNAIAYHDWYKKNEHGLNTLINGRKATSEETYNLFIKSHNSTPKP